MVMKPDEMRDVHRKNGEVKATVADIVAALVKYIRENTAEEYHFQVECEGVCMTLTAKRSQLVVWAGETSQLENIWDVWRLILSLVLDQFRADWKVESDSNGTWFRIEFPPEQKPGS